MRPIGRSVLRRLDAQRVAIARLNQLDRAVVCTNADDSAIEARSGLAVRSGWRRLGGGRIDPAHRPVLTIRSKRCDKLGGRAIRRNRRFTLGLSGRPSRVGSVTVVARHPPRLPEPSARLLFGAGERTRGTPSGRSALCPLGASRFCGVSPTVARRSSHICLQRRHISAQRRQCSWRLGLRWCGGGVSRRTRWPRLYQAAGIAPDRFDERAETSSMRCSDQGSLGSGWGSVSTRARAGKATRSESKRPLWSARPWGS
jgi:hypothetical protein